MKSKDFKQISIRGRIACGINCLENALQFYGLNEPGWEIVLKKLWEMTELPEEVNEIWLESAPEFLPVCYVEDNVQEYEELFQEHTNYIDGEFISTDKPFVSEEEFNILKAIYKKSNLTINSILKCIFWISTAKMMSGINDHSPHILNALQDILDIMNENKIPLPDINDYIEYEYDPKLRRNDYGWGKPFDGKKLSKILKN